MGIRDTGLKKIRDQGHGLMNNQGSVTQTKSGIRDRVKNSKSCVTEKLIEMSQLHSKVDLLQQSDTRRTV